MIAFRWATAEDAPAISVLTRHVIRDVNSRDYTRQEIEIACTRFSADYFVDRMKSRRFSLAEIGGQIFGQGSYGEGRIHSLFVSPDHHGKGIGQAILQRLEQVAVEAEVEIILLNSSVFAKGFYLKQGYVLLGEEHNELGTTFQMEKRLPTLSS